MIFLGKSVSIQKEVEFKFKHVQGKSLQTPPPVLAEDHVGYVVKPNDFLS